VVDHHVDRPEVEAGQPVQLTGTNRSDRLDPQYPDPVNSAVAAPARDFDLQKSGFPQ